MIRVPIQLRYNDYDDRGHVNNALYLTYFEIARAAAWEALGPAHPPSFILAEAQVTYRSPALPGEPLAVELKTGEVRTRAWTWLYRVVDPRDERLVAEGRTTQVLYDYETRQPVEIGAGLRDALVRL